MAGVASGHCWYRVVDLADTGVGGRSWWQRAEGPPTEDERQETR